MRILILADGLEGSSLSAPGRWLSSLAAHWMEAGHRVQVVCIHPLPSWQRPEDPPGVTVFRPKRQTFEAVLGEALAVDPDVVHVATAGPLGPRVVEALHELPVLLDVHDFWPACPNDDLLRRPRLTACREHWPYQGCHGCAGAQRARAMEERAELVAASRIIVARSDFHALHLSATTGREVEVVPYGVDTRRFRPDPDPPQAEDVLALYETRHLPRVLFMGPPTPARGADGLLDMLVALMARLAEVELVVAGRDPANPAWGDVFVNETRELGLGDHVRVLPAVSAADLPALYVSCPVAMSPLAAPDPGGLAILEAMACGIPIVASPLGAVEELLKQGEESLLIPSGEVPEFVTALWTMIADPIARMAFGESARMAAQERHEFEHTASRLEGLYRRLGSTPGRNVA